MGVASHLGIDLGDYDTQIRAFIPDYDEMLDVAAAAIDPRVRTLVDLGIGTGALSARCLKAAPSARVVGIDADAGMLQLATKRLDGRATLVRDTFFHAEFPACDALVASFALHHVRTRAAKSRLYQRIRAALRRRGRLISVDCNPAADRKVALEQRRAWHAHLRQVYSARRAAAILDSWSDEDVYVPLEAEIGIIQRSGFHVELLWRKGAFAVLQGSPLTRS
ncbi:MAG TPA: class I SAM-dependent methyltransferase [Vicinamibacterales bacterium]|jgi:SAM-dependent methyltransferase|nr:class I SAM-dependent methyltransferase [Vicinamibacterales bacterium]